MAYYDDLTAAAADQLLHYWSFDSPDLVITDVLNGWNGALYTDKLPSQPSPPLTADDIYVDSIFAKALDLGTQVPAAPDSRGYKYLTPVQIAARTTAVNLPSFGMRIRFYYRGPVGDQTDATIIFISDSIYYHINNGQLKRWFSNSTSGDLAPISSGAWYELVVSLSGSYLKTYLNGQQVDNGYHWNHDGVDLGSMSFFGGRGTDLDAEQEYGNLVIDEVAIWGRSMQSSEPAALYNSGESMPLIQPPSEVSIDATVPVEFDVMVGNPIPAVEIDATVPVLWQVSGYQDWLAKVPSVQLQELYRLVLTGGPDYQDDLIIGGISSWQATNQAGARSSYVQAVIPAADRYLSDISNRQNGELVIQKGYRLSVGETRFEEILRARFDQARPDEGRRSLTLTVSGYMSGKPVSSGSRTLTGIRRISKPNGKRRVTCDIDLFLQPGMTVTALGESFTADFINYYVNKSDKFCEVGER